MSSSRSKQPEMDQAAYQKIKEERHAQEKEKAAQAKKFESKYDPKTITEFVPSETLENDFFKEGEWGPGWGVVEFDGDACLKNITAKGKARDGFFAPAGTMLPLGAAIPEMTVLKYGGYFPPGTSFPGGVLVPMHARMVNLLPEESFVPAGPMSAENLCSIQ